MISVSPAGRASSRRALSRSRRTVSGAGARITWLLDSTRGRVAPKPLEAVELACLVVEDVDHDVDQVDQHPAPVRVALDVPDRGAGLLEPLHDRVGDRLDLHVGAGARDHEVVRGRRDLAEIEEAG